MKIFYTLILIALALSVSSTIHAADEEKPDKSIFDFRWSLAAKGVYSSGISDSYAYNRSDITGGFKSEYIDLSAFIRRYFHYQVTDGNGVYEYRSYNEAGLSLGAHLFGIINLSGGYSRADDFNNLKKDNYTGSLELDFAAIALTADYSYENFEYEINSNIIKTTRNDYSFESEFKFTDSFSADLGYSHSNLYFDSLGYDYYKDILRAGLTGIPSDYMFIIAGLSAGRDSEEYNIYGADCGITLLFYSRLKLSFTYSFAYYDPPQTESLSKSGGGSAMQSPTGRNPFLPADKAGEPYYSHLVSLGLTVSF